MDATDATLINIFSHYSVVSVRTARGMTRTTFSKVHRTYQSRDGGEVQRRFRLERVRRRGLLSPQRAVEGRRDGGRRLGPRVVFPAGARPPPQRVKPPRHGRSALVLLLRLDEHLRWVMTSFFYFIIYF